MLHTYIYVCVGSERAPFSTSAESVNLSIIYNVKARATLFRITTRAPNIDYWYFFVAKRAPNYLYVTIVNTF